MAHRSHQWQVTPFFSNRWVSSSPALLGSTQLRLQPPKSCPRVRGIKGCYRCACMYTHTHRDCLNSCFARLLLERPRHPFFCSFASSHIASGAAITAYASNLMRLSVVRCVVPDMPPYTLQPPLGFFFPLSFLSFYWGRTGGGMGREKKQHPEN